MARLRRRSALFARAAPLLAPLLLFLVSSSTIAVAQTPLPPCPNDRPVLFWNDCQGTHTDANGTKYVGGFSHGMFAGHGTEAFASGDQYVGEFKDGKFRGQGNETYANGNKYVGQFKDGKQTGQGNFTFADGSKYVGEFKGDKFNGQGNLTYANGNKYVGQFKDGTLYGQGNFTFANGEKYVGGFKDDKFNGQGTFTFADGSRYVGEFKDGKKNGQGTYSNVNGNKYVGEYKDGEANGKGALTFPNGDKYFGEFKHGKFDGQGTYSNVNGSITSSGIWADGKFLGVAANQEAIKMEQIGGVYVVPVRLNDAITLDAIVDSGASDVSIPADIVWTLMRTKTVAAEDFLGKKTYRLADGSEVPSQLLRIRSLQVGNKTLENVVASVASVKGDILLGQSFLSKFKSWSIDNDQHVLILR